VEKKKAEEIVKETGKMIKKSDKESLEPVGGCPCANKGCKITKVCPV